MQRWSGVVYVLQARKINQFNAVYVMSIIINVLQYFINSGISKSNLIILVQRKFKYSGFSSLHYCYQVQRNFKPADLKCKSK